jgi:hypothetical protein
MSSLTKALTNQSLNIYCIKATTRYVVEKESEEDEITKEKEYFDMIFSLPGKQGNLSITLSRVISQTNNLFYTSISMRSEILRSSLWYIRNHKKAWFITKNVEDFEEFLLSIRKDKRLPMEDYLTMKKHLCIAFDNLLNDFQCDNDEE